ncbi:glycoside hydrolase family 20 zincin-like fold domain-containing protein [Pedobacter sp. NJ-S-72]
MKKILLLISVVVFVPHFLFAQNSGHIAPSVTGVPEIKQGDTKITFPANPDGYHLLFKGSDRSPVVDSTGKIISPLVTKKVNLYFQLVNNTTDTIRFDVVKQVVIPGKYQNNAGNQQPFVIPSLSEWHGGNGDFQLKATTRIVVNTADQNILQKAAVILQSELSEKGFKLKVLTGKPQKGDIFLTLDKADGSIGEEGYYLAVTDFVKISALKYQGLFWGTRTLLQLVEQNKTIPQGIARDYPEFKVRGFVLDDGRKFFSLQFLKDYVKFMSYYKMNNFQIHF